MPRFIRFSACLLVCFAASSAGLTGCQRGENWTAQTSVTGNNLYGVHFVDEMTGWAVGSDVMMATTDGGETWEMQFGPAEHLRDVQFLDQSTGWAVGSDEEYPFNSTSDGGKNWTGMQLGDFITNSSLGTGAFLHAVHFLDANTGWVVGGGGIVLKTSDGGATWEDQSPTDLTDGLSSVHFVDSESGWVADSSGLILHLSISPNGH